MAPELEAQLLQIQSQLSQKLQTQVGNKLQAGAKTGVDANSQAQWGFLKNIVNIDRFFSSGAGNDRSSFT